MLNEPKVAIYRNKLLLIWLSYCIAFYLQARAPPRINWGGTHFIASALCAENPSYAAEIEKCKINCITI